MYLQTLICLSTINQTIGSNSSTTSNTTSNNFTILHVFENNNNHTYNLVNNTNFINKTNGIQTFGINKIHRIYTRIKAFVDMSNGFGLKLYQFMCEVYPNFLFSPISISVMMALLLRTSSGQSYNEIHDVLQLNVSYHSIDNIQELEECVENVLNYLQTPIATESMANNELKLNNRICLRDGTKIITNFMSDADKYFAAKIKAINFRLARNITDQKLAKWLENSTRSQLISHKIRLDPLREDTAMLVMSNLYMNAIDFSNGLFIKSDFFAFGWRPIKTEYIQWTKLANITTSARLNSSILKIPLQSDTVTVNKKFELIIVLPNHNHSLESTERQIFSTPNILFNELNNMTARVVNAMIPQSFIVSNCLRLDRILPHIGVKSVFQSETSQLTKLTAENLYINRIYHESYFEFKRPNNNNPIFHGSINTESTGSEKQVSIESEFIANRPFIYMIIETNSSALILMGRITII
ncbi:intracellular coagulation inhibitor 1-like isoform X2 [Oppia nitens]|uniref:intracellular coagulation inhibitor 1-like isoform X2 n=1 Tax=Oppia nitens TaxID=1686743 RepID=UPI0023DAF633|nr:intracellular coagulation inhibitor 1-like isoform X2 [Oppia nitens]